MLFFADCKSRRTTSSLVIRRFVMPEAQPKHDADQPRFRTVYIVAPIFALCGLVLHIRSYSRSDSLTLCDVCLTADEGLVSLQVPLTRLAANETPAFEAVIYERSQNVWTSGRAGTMRRSTAAVGCAASVLNLDHAWACRHCSD